MTQGTKYFRPRRLGHVNFWVKDLQRSESFYNEICGLKIQFTEPGLVASFLGTGNTPHDVGMIEATGGSARYGRDGMLQVPAGLGAAPGLGHVAWELENEAHLVEAYRRVKTDGFAMQTMDHQVAHSVYITDPDGNSAEFYCDTVKEWRKVLHGEMDLISGAWDPEAAMATLDSCYDEHPHTDIVPGSPVHPTRVTSVVLATTDVPSLVEFYTCVGGLTKVWGSTDGEVVCLQGSHGACRYHLAICQSEQTGFHHVSFELGDPRDVEEAELRLRQRGITPVQSIAHSSKRSVFLTDPDGFLVEFYARLIPDFVDLSLEPKALRPYLV